MIDTTYKVEIKTDYGLLTSKQHPRMDLGIFGEIGVMEKILERAVTDAENMRLATPDYAHASIVDERLIIDITFPLNASEIYADVNLETKAYGEHYDLNYFMPIWHVLFNDPIRSGIDKRFLPDVSVKCPSECYNLVEQVMNHFGRTLDPNQTDKVPAELLLRTSFKLENGIYTRTPAVVNEYIPVMTLKTEIS